MTAAASDQAKLLSAVQHGGKGQQVEDPLIAQLPPELMAFVKRPEDHNMDDIPFVERDEQYEKCHTCLACLCCCCAERVIIKDGQIGLTQNGDKPEILPPGRHRLLSPNNVLKEIKNQTEQVIIHGPIHIIQVRRGELGYGVDMADGEPVLLSVGKHMIRSVTFKWKNFITLRDETTELDRMSVIRIETGNVGYCFKGAQLHIMQPGLHLIAPPDRMGGIISTQIAILDLPIDNFETSDYVSVTVRASLFYRIMDPKKALLRIKNVKKQLTDTAVATLAGIIRSSSLSDVASRARPFYHDPKAAGADGGSLTSVDDSKDSHAPSAPAFYQHVHDEFIHTLADHVLEEWGVQIQNIRIESLSIADAKLQKDISSQAIEVSKFHNKYIMLQKQEQIATAEAETRARKAKIDTDAQNNTLRSKAQARADAQIIEAKADKEALTLRGQGEAEYSRLVEASALGRDLALAKVQAEALAGLKQVAYVPHLPAMLNSGTGVFAGGDMLLPKIKD